LAVGAIVAAGQRCGWCRSPGGGKPGGVGLLTVAFLPLGLEQDFGLGQHQRVRPAAAAGLVAHGQLRSVDHCVDVSAALLGKWPLEHLGCRVAEETGEHAAQLAGAVGGRLDRPVALLALRESEAGSKPIGAVAGEDVNASGAAQLGRLRGWRMPGWQAHFDVVEGALDDVARCAAVRA